MVEKRVGIYSADGLSNKIEKMRLSKREALQVKAYISELEAVPVATLMKKGKVHKVVGSDDIYVCRVNKRTRLIFSPLKGIDQVGAILYDVVDVEDKKMPKRIMMGGRKKEIPKKGK